MTEKHGEAKGGWVEREREETKLRTGKTTKNTEEKLIDHQQEKSMEELQSGDIIGQRLTVTEALSTSYTNNVYR